MISGGHLTDLHPKEAVWIRYDHLSYNNIRVAVSLSFNCHSQTYLVIGSQDRIEIE